MPSADIPCGTECYTLGPHCFPLLHTIKNSLSLQTTIICSKMTCTLRLCVCGATWSHHTGSSLQLSSVMTRTLIFFFGGGSTKTIYQTTQLLYSWNLLSCFPPPHPSLPPSMEVGGGGPSPPPSMEVGGGGPSPPPSMEVGGGDPSPPPSMEVGGGDPSPPPSMEGGRGWSLSSPLHGGWEGVVVLCMLMYTQSCCEYQEWLVYWCFYCAKNF